MFVPTDILLYLTRFVHFAEIAALCALCKQIRAQLFHTDSLNTITKYQTRRILGVDLNFNQSILYTVHEYVRDYPQSTLNLLLKQNIKEYPSFRELIREIYFNTNMENIPIKLISYNIYPGTCIEYITNVLLIFGSDLRYRTMVMPILRRLYVWNKIDYLCQYKDEFKKISYYTLYAVQYYEDEVIIDKIHRMGLIDITDNSMESALEVAQYHALYLLSDDAFTKEYKKAKRRKSKYMNIFESEKKSRSKMTFKKILCTS